MTTRQQTRKPHPKKEEAGDNGHLRSHSHPYSSYSQTKTARERTRQNQTDTHTETVRTDRPEGAGTQPG